MTSKISYDMVKIECGLCTAKKREQDIYAIFYPPQYVIAFNNTCIKCKDLRCDYHLHKSQCCGRLYCENCMDMLIRCDTCKLLICSDCITPCTVCNRNDILCRLFN